MQITKISVNGLFGIFEHVIPLNIDQRITIIHGLNGFGKSNILRILDGIFNSHYHHLEHIPFHSFIINFKDRSSLLIDKTNHNLEANSKKYSILFSLEQPGLETLCFDIKYKISFSQPTDLLNASDQRDHIVEFQNRKFKVRKKDTPRIVGRTNQIEPNWFQDIKSHNSIRLIESQRLLDVNNNDFSTMLPTVSTYSKELARLMRDKFAEYGKQSQSLDRTFPIRAVQQQHSTDLTDEQLKAQLNELEDTRNYLTELGLLDKEENSDFPNQLEDIDESTRNILSVYVEDTKNKLNIFNNIASKIELLKTILNRKFAYSYKEMNFSKEQGFIFTTCYPNSSESDAKTISPTDLSSGEQHELVLLYELLFKVEPNSLVLIDEPELSLHVGWQSQFLKDLQEITKLADLDILLATHSPDIIQDRWDDLTVELKPPGR